MLFITFPAFLILLMTSEMCNNTSNKGLSHCFFLKKTVDFRQKKSLKVRQKNVLVNDNVIKNYADVIILIM